MGSIIGCAALIYITVAVKRILNETIKEKNEENEEDQQEEEAV